jgi:hypothetical protein
LININKVENDENTIFSTFLEIIEKEIKEDGISNGYII